MFRDIYSASRVHEKRTDKIKSQHVILFKNKINKFMCRNSLKLKDEDVRKKTSVIPDLWKEKWSTLFELTEETAGGKTSKIRGGNIISWPKWKAVHFGCNNPEYYFIGE